MVCVSSNDEYENLKLKNIKVFKDNEGLQSAVLELNSHVEARLNGNESLVSKEIQNSHP